MDEITIDERIVKMKTIKSGLLKLKKEHRKDELKRVNDIINRLKNWKNELNK